MSQGGVELVVSVPGWRVGSELPRVGSELPRVGSEFPGWGVPTRGELPRVGG